MSFSAATPSSVLQASVVDSRPETVITTTIFANVPTVSAAPSSGGGKDVPIAAIAGGAAGGIFLAIAAVLVWHWWGWSIKRKEDEEKKQTFAFVQLRENTRRNASTVMHNYTNYRPSFTLQGHKRKVKFASNGSSSEKNLNRKGKYVAYAGNDLDESKSASMPPPNPPSQTTTPIAAPRPGPTHVPRSGDRSSYVSHAVNQRATTLPLEPPSLAHKGSTVSSASMYSTQSGEEHQMRVPSSLIMAALGRLDPRRSLSSGDRRSGRHSTAPSDDLNRLSFISVGSAYLQLPSDQSDAQVGLAK